jgi:ABC-2 type transport system permease protein
MRTLGFLLRKEFLQIVRDRAMLRLLIIVPVMQLLVLGSAATFEIRRTPLYVIDHDQTSSSRGLVERLVASGRFEAVDASQSPALADRAMLAREVAAIVQIPHDFERDLVRTSSAPVQLVLDAEDGAAAGIRRAYALQILERYSAELASTIGPAAGIAAPAQPAGVPAARIDLRLRGWFNPELRYTDFMVPGILVLLITVVATAVGSMNIVREKEIGTLEQLNVTPVTRGQFIAAKLIPFWIIALVDLALGLGVGRLVVDVPVRGSLLLVFGAAMVYLVAALAIGLWISTRVETQQQAMLASFSINMIYLLMSGLFTPLQSMPRWAQWIAELSPLKHFIVIMRGVLIMGAGLAEVAAPLGVLALYGTLVLALAVRQYSKTAG